MAQQTRYQILEALRKGEGGTVSGGELAQTLGVSRTAVWKAVTTLQNEGYRIESVPNKGYRLLESEVYSGYEVERRLTTKVVGRPLIFLEEVNSTNDYVKALAAEGGAKRHCCPGQTADGGEGTAGPPVRVPGGERRLFHPFAAAGYSDRDAQSDHPADGGWQWRRHRRADWCPPGDQMVNDLYLNGKKLCGILTECSVEGETGGSPMWPWAWGSICTRRRKNFPPELREKAGSIEMLTGKHIAAADYAVTVFRRFEELFFDEKFPENQERILRRYREDLFFLGQEVEVHGLSDCYRATALDIDEEGRLLVRDGEGALHALNSGEISIRFS